MSKRKKRLSKIRNNPKAVTKDDLDTVLRDFGFVERDGKGSHTIYQHPDNETPLVVAAHGKSVPAYIVKQALALIDALVDEDQTDEPDDTDSGDN
jgi:predicted RNA binding protein YcfA (HicA-like mRNA interferase family)